MESKARDIQASIRKTALHQSRATNELPQLRSKGRVSRKMLEELELAEKAASAAVATAMGVYYGR